jgi:hypothetical protein
MQVSVFACECTSWGVLFFSRWPSGPVSVALSSPRGPVTRAASIPIVATFSSNVTGVNVSDFQIALPSGVLYNVSVVPAPSASSACVHPHSFV